MRGGSRGFTMIEMLVVTSILVVLAAIITPVFETATKRAERASCLSNIRNLGLAANLYADDCDDMYPPARGVGGPGLIGTCWDVLMYPYFENELMLICPSDQAANWATGYTCYTHSYGSNWDIMMPGGTTGAALQRQAVSQPAETIIFFEIKGSLRAIGADYDTHGLSRIDNRHGGGANYAFCEGNAKWLRPNQTETPVDRWHP
jgi:prepilin-type N-terminal cleavage/methylation domain-containing protein